MKREQLGTHALATKKLDNKLGNQGGFLFSQLGHSLHWFAQNYSSSRLKYIKPCKLVSEGSRSRVTHKDNLLSYYWYMDAEPGQQL